MQSNQRKANNMKESEKEKVEKRTREIYHNIHIEQGDDRKIYDRLINLLSTDYLRVSKDFFHGKICLDAGCGSNANAAHSMLIMGAKKVYAFDLDDSIFQSVPKHLQDFKGRYDLNIGNVMNMNYPDNFFDFSLCAGVLHSIVEPYSGFRELARVTKPGGFLHITIVGKVGLVGEITNFLRDKYVNDTQFKELIDNLNEEDVTELWEWIIQTMIDQGDDLGKKIPFKLIKKFFNRDLVLTIKDRITTPIYNYFSEKEIVKWFDDNGFTGIERLTRYPKIGNIRRFAGPFYYKYDHKFSRLFFGAGHMQFKATKC